jgi:glycosyltransferase involved in cell wall biosynthesis
MKGGSMAASTPQLSIVVPVFNEERTIDAVLTRLASVPYAYPDQQVVVVDDGSTDHTAQVLSRWAGRPGFVLLRHPLNLGKGAAFRSALAHVTGIVTVVQDADLEYDPADLPRLVEPILGGECVAVYGSRYLGPNPNVRWTQFRLGVSVMNLFVRVLYGLSLTDVATCYKALPTDLYRKLDLRAERFELCAEVTAKICRLGIHPEEVAISYRPRSRHEGKKIGWRDACSFGWALWTWRVRSLSCSLTQKSLRFTGNGETLETVSPRHGV